MIVTYYYKNGDILMKCKIYDVTNKFFFVVYVRTFYTIVHQLEEYKMFYNLPHT